MHFATSSAASILPTSRGMRAASSVALPFLVVAAACGGAVDSTPGSGSSGNGDSSVSEEIVSVSFSSGSSNPAYPPPNVHVTVNDATRARALYKTLRAQPAFPQETLNCPADFEISYRVTFLSSAGTTVAWASLDPNGCEPLWIGSGSDQTELWADNVWPALAQGLGIPESEIYPYQPQETLPPPPADAGTPVIGPVTGDASVTPGVDGGPTIEDDGGVFTCGTGTLTCDGHSQICAHVIGGAPPGVDFYECKPIPAACATDVTCTCVVPAMKNEAAASCTAAGSDLTVIFAVP